MIFEINEDPDWAGSMSPWTLKVDGINFGGHMDASQLAVNIAARIKSEEATRKWRNGKR